MGRKKKEWKRAATVKKHLFKGPDATFSTSERRGEKGGNRGIKTTPAKGGKTPALHIYAPRIKDTPANTVGQTEKSRVQFNKKKRKRERGKREIETRARVGHIV